MRGNGAVHAGCGDVPPIRLEQLIDSYDGFLLDAYGVLLDDTGPLPGAVEFLRRLNSAGKPWRIVTNAASRTPEQLATDFSAKGLALGAEDILSSGMLLESCFAAEGLQGEKCLLLGPPTSRPYVTRAGGELDDSAHPLDASVVIIADQSGVRWPDDFNRALNVILHRLSAGLPLHLLLCNPDLIFPCAPGVFSLTAGAMAALFERVIEAHCPSRPTRFVRLGKPGRPIFDEARRQLGGERLVMVGDQLGTDIRGARDADMDAVLVGAGLAGGAPLIPGSRIGDPAPRPTWRLQNLTDDHPKNGG